MRASRPAAGLADPPGELPVSQRPDGSQPLRQLELRVNPIACAAHGLCIELLPELISADPWGYPIMAPGPVPLRLLSLARRAVADCPTLALLLTDRQDDSRP
jgi:ferredoxin